MKSSKSNLRVTSVHNSVITNTGVWGGGGGRKGWWEGEAGGAAAYYESFLPNWTFLLHILSQTVGVAGSGKKVVLEKKTELKRACLNTIPITS